MGKNKMIACNDYLIITILFTAGITLIIAGIFLLIARHFILKKCDRDIEKNNKLIESFNRNKLKGGYIKKWITTI